MPASSNRTALIRRLMRDRERAASARAHVGTPAARTRRINTGLDLIRLVKKYRSDGVAHTLHTNRELRARAVEAGWSGTLMRLSYPNYATIEDLPLRERVAATDGIVLQLEGVTLAVYSRQLGYTLYEITYSTVVGDTTASASLRQPPLTVMADYAMAMHSLYLMENRTHEQKHRTP